LLSLLAAGFLGCNNTTTTADAAAVADMTVLPDLIPPGPPPAPTLGMQIDRMGRAGVNTALTDPFDIVPNMTPDMVKDAYNSASDPTMWGTMFAPLIAKNLAILDGADTMCGNQILAGMTATAGRYNTLAGALADDRLYVNTASGTCMQYLAVEAAVAGLPTGGDCGGRTPVEDTISLTYTVLIAGAGGLGTPITSGITKDADGNPMATGFPFLGNPN
jgi:hypothetical protein